jgi:2OG-Fe(II) oxygenase superfamily
MTTTQPLLLDPGFLDLIDCSALVDDLSDAARATDDVRVTEYRTEMAASVVLQAGPNRLRELLLNVRRRAQKLVADFYNVGDDLVLEFTLYSEMRTGDSHPLHADAETVVSEGRWRPNHTPWRHSVALLYLNTCGLDFGGGVLVLPYLRKRIPPRVGTMVGFPATHDYCHEVTPIEWGTRRTLAMWMTTDPDFREDWPDTDSPYR